MAKLQQENKQWRNQCGSLGARAPLTELYMHVIVERSKNST